MNNFNAIDARGIFERISRTRKNSGQRIADRKICTNATVLLISIREFCAKMNDQQQKSSRTYGAGIKMKHRRSDCAFLAHRSQPNREPCYQRLFVTQSIFLCNRIRTTVFSHKKTPEFFFSLKIFF